MSETTEATGTLGTAGPDGKPFGSIGWVDLTVPDADGLRDFYAAVVGWQPIPVEMDGYADYAMQPAGASDAVAGVCHARSINAGFPPYWLIYITVSDAEAAAEKAVARGGAVITKHIGPDGKANTIVIRDPAGAFFGLYQPPA
jgi:uncharacterized protein